jgi:hypothetical protein
MQETDNSLSAEALMTNDTNSNDRNTSININHEEDTLGKAETTTEGNIDEEDETLNNLEKEPVKIYNSQFLYQTFKPLNETLELTPELESLRPLILLQHKAFTQHIKDLGTINLTFTKDIEKKKEGLQNLQKNGKIPRSLHIKCELTTSPDFTNDPDFLQLKDELQQETNNYIKKGTTIMTTWALKHLNLLKIKRGTNYLKKALQILEGLTSFFTDSVGIPLWPSVKDSHLSLFIFKIYLSNAYININDITDFLELPPDQILAIGSKLLLNTDSDTDALNSLNALKMTDIDMSAYTDNTFLTANQLSSNPKTHHS